MYNYSGLQAECFIVSYSSGSVLLESTGDVSLSQSEFAEETVEFSRITTFDIGNPGTPSAGQPIAGSQRFIAGYGNEGGDFVALSPEFLTQDELENWIDTADFTDIAYDPIRLWQTLPGFGGNLYVEGTAYIGELAVDGVADVAAAIAANTQAIALNAAESQNNINVVEASVIDNAVAIEEINAQHHALLLLISEVQDQYAGLSLVGVALNPNGANSLNVEFVIESSVNLETWTPIRTVSETVDTTGVPKQFIRVRAVDSPH